MRASKSQESFTKWKFVIEKFKVIFSSKLLLIDALPNPPVGLLNLSAIRGNDRDTG